MPKTLEFDSDVSDQIVAMRNDGSKWDEISEAVGHPSGKCMLMYAHATVRPKDRVKNATPEQVVAMRDDESLSWGVISARTGYPESSLRGMYEEHTNKSTKGNRIGKGGRHPETPGTPRTAKAKKAGGAKKAASKKPAPKETPLVGLSPEEITEAITHRAIKILTGDGEEIIKVKSVKRVNKASIALSDETGKGRTVKTAAVFQVSKGKVIKG